MIPCAGEQWLLEVAIADQNGKVLFQSTVNHGKTIEEMYEIAGRGSWFHFPTVAEIYGISKIDIRSATTTTPGLTIPEIAADFAKPIHPQDYMIEWSTGFCDFICMWKAFEPFNLTDFLPPKDHWLRGILAWRRLVPGFFTFTLSIAFPIFCPDEDHFVAHRAAADAKMRFIEGCWVVFKFVFTGEGRGELRYSNADNLKIIPLLHNYFKVNVIIILFHLLKFSPVSQSIIVDQRFFSVNETRVRERLPQ